MTIVHLLTKLVGCNFVILLTILPYKEKALCTLPKPWFYTVEWDACNVVFREYINNIVKNDNYYFEWWSLLF